MTEYEKKNIINTLSDDEIEMIKEHRKELQEQAEKEHIFDDLRHNLLKALEDIFDKDANLILTFHDEKGIGSVNLNDVIQMNLSYRNISRAIEIIWLELIKMIKIYYVIGNNHIDDFIKSKAFFDFEDVVKEVKDLIVTKLKDKIISKEEAKEKEKELNQIRPYYFKEQSIVFKNGTSIEIFTEYED